ncbi:MAG TPA: Fic family protein [Thermoanaerobaculia bacterium]|nr:Fic family protein [Thermoanaerobaculia bacterium]
MQETREAVIDPEQPYPLRAGLRYELSPYTLAKLEKLARAKFEIGRFTSDDFIGSENADEAALRNLAQSVNASSEIEGEEIPAHKLDLALAAATRPSARRIDEELEQRTLAVSSIIRTLLWALLDPPREFLSFDFVLEIHRRMFESTNPEVAGRIKTKRVAIEGSQYAVKTLPPAKSEPFLRELCDRANASLAAADTSRFLTTAEFILDFLAIHPFHDGNGRTARLLSTYLLERSGYHFARFYPLDSVILENRDAYYEALFRAQQRWYQPDEDLTPWIELYTDMVFNQYVRALQRVKDAHVRQR